MPSTAPFSVSTTGSSTWDLLYDFRVPGLEAGGSSDAAPTAITFVNTGAATVYVYDEAKHGNVVTNPSSAAGIPILAGGSLTLYATNRQFRRAWVKSATAAVVVGGGIVI